MAELLHTPFHSLQAKRGARFVSFAGYELPVQFTGVIAEHTAVRQQAGLFDVSHMGEFIVEGPQALDAVQYAVTNNVAKLVDGKALYTVMCLENGGIVDDLIVYRVAADKFFLVVNGARRAADWQHLRKLVDPYDCRLRDESEGWAQLALQGPNAMAIAATQTSADLAGLKPFTFVDTEFSGVSGVRVARTGYTGEDGVELYVAAEQAPKLWAAIEEAGQDSGLALCGLASRDTLRLEMKFALYGNDIDEEHNPYEAGLGWVVKLKAGDFHGRERLVQIKAEGPKRKLVGIKMAGRGIPRQGYPIAKNGNEIGVVTSGTHSPSLGVPIGIGYVTTDYADTGTDIDIVIRGKAVAAHVVETPFYKRDAQ